MTDLLNIDTNAKTVKGQAKGYMTAVMYLAPHDIAGATVCPNAILAGCGKACLNTAGRGGIAKDNAIIVTDTGRTVPDNTIQRARIKRTRLFHEDRTLFLDKLITEIERFIRRADKAGLTPVVRLNGTSDIRWEDIPAGASENIFDVFPTVQFYDYTKLPSRFSRPLPDNYHLTLSFSGASRKYVDACRWARSNFAASTVAVYRTKEAKAKAMEKAYNMGHTIVDGDEHDLRFLDPKRAAVFLTAKGQAKHDTSGFVQDAY